MTQRTAAGRFPRVRQAGALLLDALRAHPGPVIWGLCGSLLYGTSLVAWSVALGELVNHVVIPRYDDGRIATGALVAALLAVTAIGVVQGAAGLLRRWTLVVTRARFDATLRDAVVRHYHRLPMTFHQTRSTGQKLAHVTSDAEAAAELPARLPDVLGMFVLFLATAIWALAVDPVLALVGGAMIPALLVVNSVYQKQVEAPAQTVQERLGRVTEVAHESFDGAALVKTLGRERVECERFAAEAAALRDAKIRLALRDWLLDSLIEAIPSATSLAMVVVGALRVNSGDITIGTLVSFVNVFALLVVPVRTIGNVLGDIPRMLAGYARVRSVLDEPLPAPPADPEPLPDGPLGLRVHNLTYGYPGGTTALSDVSFQVPPGATVAVTGGTGSGKSTLLLALAGLLPVPDATILVNGADLGRISAADRAAAIATAFQEPFLFAASLAENVLLDFDGAHTAEAPHLHEALRRARADGLTAGRPEGPDTPVGERGITLSGGERQRIALARALARRPRLLLLDEATSAVDATTRLEIMSGLTEGPASTTTIVVTTSAETLALADTVVYLDRGRVAGVGPHTDLVRLDGYDRLIRAFEREQVQA
ncbi:ABC transporter ATP-binding protein [Streptomyces sp. NPDC006422]|uniref:ABC transporter ATP-binding protein n=1 Tax=unclassified Streptomyces TaxID=2593676 RepID=UPI0033B90811